MKVQATAKGFFNGEVRNYNDQTQVGDSFVIESRLDKDDKSVKAADHTADIEAQFSSKWMKKA